MAIEIGSVVCLKSGGPDMTVSNIEADVVYVQWFDKNEVIQYGQFGIPLLEEVDSSSTAGGIYKS